MIPKVLTPFFHFRDELIVQEGLVFIGNRFFVPKAMQRSMRELAHPLRAPKN